jgi:2-iminobutanoate/2-iminopropanoate deaminase
MGRRLNYGRQEESGMTDGKAGRAEKAPVAVGPYSLVRQAGDLYFISGQIGLDPESGELSGPGVEEQAHQALRNLDRVLLGAGLGREHIVKATVYLTNMDDFALVNEIYAGFFAGFISFPARACVAVAALPKGAKVEIEAVAYKTAELG